MIAIQAIAVAEPDVVVPVAELPEVSVWPDAERAALLGLGIETVAADPAGSPADLAARAGRAALAEAGLTPDDVDALVHIESRVPEAFMASEATRVQSAVGAERAVTFSVGGLGCVSITPALMAASGLLASNPAMAAVLIVHGSMPPAPRRYRHPVTVNGEAGLGLLVGRAGALTVGDLALETNGAYWDLFRVDYRDRPSADWVEACSDLPTYSFRLAIESRNRFRAINESLLRRSGLDLADVDHFVMQNLSEGAFRFYEEAFGIRFADACRTNLRRRGHLGPIDVALNLRTGIDTGEFAGGDRVLVMNASPAAAWSTMLVEVGTSAPPSAIEL